MILDNSQDLPLLIQKTSGLFDSIQAVSTVANKALKPECGIDADMDNCNEMDLGDHEENLYLGMPIELADDDYLDSFVDLADLLLLEDVSKDPIAASIEVTEKVDCSDVISVPNAALAAMAVSDAVTSISKRIHVKEIDNIVNIDDIGHELSMSDHDYVTKKPKLALPAGVLDSLTSAPQNVVPKVTEISRYRERRDKNNEASRRSRQTRKLKYKEMDEEADILIVKNEALRRKIAELEELAKIMKATLIQKMTAK